MGALDIHHCECPIWKPGNAASRPALHRRINLLVSRLDEQQRRWYVAMESDRVGPGGEEVLSQITGMDPKTIQRGRQELETGLADRPQVRVRLAFRGKSSCRNKDPA